MNEFSFEVAFEKDGKEVATASFVLNGNAESAAVLQALLEKVAEAGGLQFGGGYVIKTEEVNHGEKAE